MRWSIDKSICAPYLHVKIEGAFNIEAVALMCASILASKDWESGMPILLDNRKNGPFDDHPSASAMISRALSVYEELARSIPSCCIAVLMDPESDFLDARQLQYALLLKDLPANIQIFFIEENALEWIGLCGSR